MLCAFWIFAFVWKFPLGYFLSPLINRTQFVIEFLYPSGLGRWIQVSISNLMARSLFKNSRAGDKNRGFHSRSVETRIEVVPKRLYIHPLPQYLDNIGYLIVCLPEQQEVTVVDSTPMGNVTATTKRDVSPPRIVAIIVDCGDASAVLRHLKLISDVHYQRKKIHVQAILSTHKHHDHTAGNRAMLRNKETAPDLKIICGGTVEKVPGCNFFVENGDLLPLPRFGGNKMDELIEIEAVATPAHTRGSISYIMRLQPDYLMSNSALGFLFTGDTIFSAGAGVPFEADIDVGQDSKEHKQTFASIIKASASVNAMERCFGEVLARSLRTKASPRNLTDRLLLMPGHEYSNELLSRQLVSTNNTDNCKWKNFSPQTFFETVSHYYVTLHRKALPQSTGKLLSAFGSPISLEMAINPYFRSMRKRGEVILQAIQFWHKHFARTKVPGQLPPTYYAYFANVHENGSGRNPSYSVYSKTASNESQWTLDAADLAEPVFTTLYSTDLDEVIRELQEGKLTSQEGAQRLRSIKKRLRDNVVSRRPVPATLPSDRAVYRGLLALALLGSSPTALTLSDSRRMKLPPPVHKYSDQIKVSRRHLIAVLQCLGLLTAEDDGPRLIAMIHQVWKEAIESSPTHHTNSENGNYDTIDLEADENDIVDLGDLKYTIYGVPRRQSTFSYCLPCFKPRRMDPSHPVHSSGMKPHSGEIVRHDVYKCRLTQSRTGLNQTAGKNRTRHGDLIENVANQPTRPVIARIGSSGSIEDEEEDGAHDGMYVEVTSMLRDT